MIYGIDASHNNTITNIHTIVAAASLSFIFFKATQGTDFIDPTFRERFSDTRQYEPNLIVGAYHFLNSSPPAEQALFFHNIIKSFGYSPGCLIPCLDSEPNPNGWRPTAAATSCFLDEYEKLSGCRPGLYSGDAYIQAAFTGVSPAYWWVARYGSKPRTKYDIWQNSESRLIGGNMYDFDQYDGTIDQFKEKFVIK